MSTDQQHVLDILLCEEEYLEDQVTLHMEHLSRLREGSYRVQFDALVEQARDENNQQKREEGRWPRHPSGKRPRP
jgi:hypothetical protein